MKYLLVVGAMLVGFLAIPEIYSTMKGYTVWLWRNPHAQIFVDGRRVSGYVHQSKRAIIVTRSDLPLRRSLWFTLSGQSTVTSSSCGDWSAPDSFVLAVGDVNPPCFMIEEPALHVPYSPVPGTPIVSDGKKLEYRTNNGKLIKVVFQ